MTTAGNAVYRGYRASEKPRCDRCGGFLSETDDVADRDRYVCPNCGPVRIWTDG